MFDAWCLMLDVWYLMFDAWFLMFDAWCLMLDAWCLTFDTWCLMLDMNYLCLFDAWYLMLNACCLKLAMNYQEIGAFARLYLWFMALWALGSESDCCQTEFHFDPDFQCDLSHSVAWHIMIFFFFQFSLFSLTISSFFKLGNEGCSKYV